MKRRMMRGVGVLGLLALATACGEEVRVGDDADNNSANSTQNNSSNQSNNQTNNNSNNTSGSNQGTTGGCDSDAACGAGLICEAGSCAVGCRDTTGCEGVQVCHEGRCVECVGDADCSNETICVEDACVAGCRDDAGCEDGRICEAGSCAAGCRDDAACGEGEICAEGSCAAGCRDDAACDAGAICVEESCVTGCRDDAGCEAGRICVEATCALRGVACREDGDCNGGDVCQEGSCVAGETPCVADGAEPNDEAAGALALGTTPSLGICPGDVDRFAVTLEAGDRLEVTVIVQDTGAVTARLEREGSVVAMATPINTGLRLTWTAEPAGSMELIVEGASPEARQSYGLEARVTPAAACVEEVILYTDADGDGWGTTASEAPVCIPEEGVPAGFAREGEDCAPADSWRHPGGQEICGDQLDDDCNGLDAPCPASQPSVVVPSWSCGDDSPPASVYAWARFDDGGGYFQDGGCFVIFEGLAGEFYVKRHLTRVNTAASCDSIDGCVCPSLNGWRSYDRRLYAFTRQAEEVGECAPVSIRDHGGETQPVSSSCRKYMYQLHYYDIPYSFMAAGTEALERRLSAFPVAEIACAEDAPHASLPFQSLLMAPFVRNPGFVGR